VPSNLKRMVRDRMAATGQSWAGALRDLRKADATPCECGHARRDHNADHPCLVDGCKCTNYNPPEVTR
jgi:hypothetical protein